MTDARNPYAPPTTPVSDPIEPFAAGDDGEFVPNGRARSPGRGAGWLADAWQMFRARPGKWLVNLVLMLVIYIVAGIIPILGNILSMFIWPFLGAAIVWAAHTQRRTGTFEVNTLFDGIRAHSTALLVVGAVFFLAALVFVLALFAIFGFSFFGQLGSPSSSASSAAQLWSSMGSVLLLYAVIVVPVGFATYFAPALIVLHRLPAGTAMKMSLSGCVKNILPGIVFAVCAGVLLVVSMIPIGLGLLISVPMMMIATYTAYRDIFIDSEVSASSSASSR